MAKDRKTDMVILGLLNHDDLSGYDIKKRIDDDIRFFWKGSFGSIYPALTELVNRGLIEKIEESGSEETGNSELKSKLKIERKIDRKADRKREKIKYRITDAGRESLREWVSDIKATNDLKYETLLKLFFGGAAEPEVSIRNIELFEDDIRRDLYLLKSYRDILNQAINVEIDHKYYYLTVLFGIETYEGYLRWCTEAKEMLRGEVK